VGLEVKEVVVDGCQFGFLRLAYACLRPLQGSLRGNDQPALGHAIMTKIKALIASRVVAGTPDDVHRQLEPWEGLCDLLLLYCPPHFADPTETKANHEAMIAAFST